MALKKLKWLKYLFVNRTEAETEQNYWNEKRKKHLANEHSEGVVVGLEVTETSLPSLKVQVHGGRALDADGNDPEIESVQEIDLASLVPASGTKTVYITLKHNEVEVEPYFVDEIAGYQNKYVQDSYQLEATISAPSAPAVELARVTLGAGATAIIDAINPDNPQTNEIDLRSVNYSGKEVTAIKDLSDVSEDEADAFNAMENPSASNPITTVSKADSIVAPIRDEVTTARGTKTSLDARLDVMLNNDGSFKGITKITPSAPLTGGGTAGDVPLGIDTATQTSKGAMSSADKAKLDGIESGATGDQTAAEILTALKTVDGSGSGLDADLLDGVEHRGAGGTSEHPVATTSQAGFMSTSDKSKLNGIESGATADMTAQEILDAVKTVDGSGSGLDADLLDGVSHRGSGGTSEHPAATTTEAGFMSKDDKSKLDGIESGATADQTASEILTALKTVDGDKSGLDADTVDGKHASELASDPALINHNLLAGLKGASVYYHLSTKQNDILNTGYWKTYQAGEKSPIQFAGSFRLYFILNTAAYFGDRTFRIHLEKDGGENGSLYSGSVLLADWDFDYIPNPGWIREFYVSFNGIYQTNTPSWWAFKINSLQLVPSDEITVFDLTGIGSDVSKQLTARRWDLLFNYNFRGPTGYTYWGSGAAYVSGNIYFTYYKLPQT